MKTKAAPMVGILIGQAKTPNDARAMADAGLKCPYCAYSASNELTLVGVYVIPPDQQWWLEWVEESPDETLGLKEASVFFPEGIKADSAWSRGEVRPSLAQAPCGANCPECQQYNDRCRGCPATRHFVA